MRTESSILWVEAAKKAIANPKAILACPECKTGKLVVKDEPFGENQIDRYLICDNCGVHNVITMSKPDQ